MIPKQLQNPNFRYLKLRPKGKEPTSDMTDWKKNSLKFNDTKLLDHLEADGNYAILGGYVNLIMIDADSPKINDIAKTLPETFTIKTGNPKDYKKHYYYICDKILKPIRFTKVKVGDLGDVRSEGQYVVAPGSIHPTGNPYKVTKDIPISQITEEEIREAFKEFIDPKDNTEFKDYPIETKLRSSQFVRECRVPDYALNNKMKGGSSKNWKFFPYIVDVLHNREVRQEVYQALVRKQGHQDGAIKGWVMKAHEGKLAKTSCKKMKDYLKKFHPELEKEICGNCPLNKTEPAGKVGMPTLTTQAGEMMPASLEDFLIIKYNKKGEEVSRSVNIDKVAEHIENKFNIRTIYGLKEETIEIYIEGIWNVTGKGIIKSEIEKILETYSKNNIVAEILEKIKRRTEISREKADDIPDYKRCVGDGVLELEDVNNIKFSPHNKNFNFRSKFPIKYNPKAKCPNIIKFMEEVLDEKDILLIQEWFGFHLPRRYCFKKALIVYGAKNTSKTVLINLLTSFVGDNVSGLSLQEISRGKAFDLIALKDKDANICDDLSSADMENVGGFKMAVGDGWISGEQKFGDKIRFRNTAKDTNTCNQIPSPKTDIDDMAYYERILLLPMDNIIPKDKIDKDLIFKLTTQEELSGLLNWVIEGYKRLVTNNSFSNEKTPEETKFIMVQKGNSLAKFSNEVLIHEDGLKVQTEIMYRVYCKWCMEHNPQLSPESKDKIGKTLTRFAPFTQSCGGKERYWSNVKITDRYDIFLESIKDILKSNKSDNNVSENNIYKFSKPVIPVSKQPPLKLTDEELKNAGYSEEEQKEIKKIQEEFDDTK